MMQLTQTTQQRQQLSPSMIFSLKVLEMNEAMSALQQSWQFRLVLMRSQF